MSDTLQARVERWLDSLVDLNPGRLDERECRPFIVQLQNEARSLRNAFDVEKLNAPKKP